MMNAMRKHTKVILWIVVATFVGTIFFVWGMDAGRKQSFTEEQSAAVVNDIAISYEEFGRLWEQRYRQMYENSNEDPSPQEIQRLREDLVETMIEGALLEQLTTQMNIKVYSEEVRARISTIQAFQENGKFSQEKYVRLLGYNRIDPALFEAEQQKAIAMAKMSQMLKDSIVVSDADVKEYFHARNRKLKLSGVIFDWKKNLKKVTVKEEALKNYYTSNAAQYDQPEQVKASHILISVDQNATPEDKTAAKVQTEDILNKIKGGADFAKLAKEHSSDPGTKDKGGDLGFFKKGMMVPPFETAAFALKKGELSDIVETRFGFHIIKVTGRKAGKKATFKSVRSEIRKKLLEEEAKKETQKQALAFQKDLLETKNIAVSSKSNKIPTINFGWVKEGATLRGLTDSDRVMDQALDMSLNQPSSAVFDGENIVFVEVVDEQFQPFNEKLFELEKDSLTEKYKTIRGDKARDAWINQAKADAKIINNILKERKDLEEETAEKKTGDKQKAETKTTE